MGGSYGGFMTTWLASHAGDRFTAAIMRAGGQRLGLVRRVQRHRLLLRRAVRRAPTRRLGRAQSPLAYADKIDLPVLIIHSEQDWRCPVEQAQRLFVALKLRGVDAELLLFPGEGHELCRSGRPSHRRGAVRRHPRLVVTALRLT